MRVAVGTSNELKVRAVERAFRRYMEAKAEMVEVGTGRGRQPSGILDVAGGALERALEAYRRGGYDYGVGIEAGPIEFPSSTGYLETQVAVIVGGGCRASVGLSPSFELEKGVLEAVLAGVELEAVVAARGVARARPLGETIGYIGVLSRGYITRLELTEAAVAMALIPWISGAAVEGSLESLASQLGLKVSC